MKQINSININKQDLPAASTIRTLSIDGESGSEFLLQVFNSSQQFYNFTTQSFSSVSNSESIVKGNIKGSTYRTAIKFPATSGDTYTVLVIAPLDKDTEFSYTSKRSDSFTITQVGNSTLTFTPLSATSVKYGDMPTSITSAASPTSVSIVEKSLNWDLPGAESDANGFGLRLIRQPIDTDWYFTTTETVNGTISSSTEVVVDDLTDLATGMHVTAVSAGSLTGTPTIKSIDIGAKKLTLSAAQSFNDNITLTFQARGSSVIQKAIGANIGFSNFNASTTSATSAKLTKKVRATASSNDIALVGTYGISGGGFVTMSGVGIKNTDANTVQVVTADSVEGSVQTEETQLIKIGTLMYFTGSTLTVSVVNTFTINSHPSANRIIYLNLDNFITPGVSGS